MTQPAGEETDPGVAGGRGGNRTDRITAGGARAPESTRESTSPATPPHHDPGTPVVTESRDANGHTATAHPVKSTPRQMATAGAARPGRGKGQANQETDGAEVPGSSDAAATGAGSPANKLTATRPTGRDHQRRSDEAVSGPGKGGATRFADMDADEPDAVSPDNAPPRGKP